LITELLTELFFLLLVLVERLVDRLPLLIGQDWAPSSVLRERRCR
jgi:hypothetical protein